MRVAIIRFPGTNCDYDCAFACRSCNVEYGFVWHKETTLDGYDCAILPGGFSYGDYLRSGALASFSPIMQAVREFAKRGGYVVGICNGFQMLTELGLLPGVLLKNRNLRFIHKRVWLKFESSVCRFSENMAGRLVRLPIAHAQGCYYCTQDELKRLEDDGCVVLRYASPQGEVTDEHNPNGSVSNIAGICNREGNIFGLMPHPERSVGDLGNDGTWLFSVLAS